jgi:hypothetical protein
LTDRQRFLAGVVELAVRLQAETAAVEAERAAKLAGKARRAAGRARSSQDRRSARLGARGYTGAQIGSKGLQSRPAKSKEMQT